MTEIIDVYAREILDSRGNPSIEVEVTLSSEIVGRESVIKHALHSNSMQNSLRSHTLCLQRKDREMKGGLKTPHDHGGSMTVGGF